MITFPAYTISFPSWYWVSLTKTGKETKTQAVVQLQYLPTPSTDMPGIHTYIHTQTHIHISMYVFSLRIFNYIARRQRKKWKANLHKPKPQTTHTSNQTETYTNSPPSSSLSFFIFTHIFWLFSGPELNYLLASVCFFVFHKAFCNWIMTSKSVWHLLLFFL